MESFHINSTFPSNIHNRGSKHRTLQNIITTNNNFVAPKQANSNMSPNLFFYAWLKYYIDSFDIEDKNQVKLLGRPPTNKSSMWFTENNEKFERFSEILSEKYDKFLTAVWQLLLVLFFIFKGWDENIIWQTIKIPFKLALHYKSLS